MRAYGISNFRGLLGMRKSRFGKGFRQKTCSCCIKFSVWAKCKSFKKKARQEGKKSCHLEQR